MKVLGEGLLAGRKSLNAHRGGLGGQSATREVLFQLLQLLADEWVV